MKPYQKHEREKRDEQAARYEEWYEENKGALFDERERAVFTSILRDVPAGVGIDLGAGTGRITEAMSGRVPHVVSVDLSLGSLELLAKKGLPACTPVCADASRLPFNDATFDIGFSCQLIQVMRFDELLGAFEEIHRILAPGGSFVVSTYNLPYWGYRGVVELGDAGETYVRPFTDGFLRYLADKVGFEVIRTGYYKALPFRKLKGRAWLAVDRALGSVPFARKRLNQFIVVHLRKAS